MLMWWDSALIAQEYDKATKTIRCAELFETDKDYFRKDRRAYA